MQAENIKTLSFGCRLNALECEKIKRMIATHVDNAVIVNTCSVTAEAERQSAQSVRRIARENPNVPIFVTGRGNPQSVVVRKNPEYRRYSKCRKNKSRPIYFWVGANKPRW